ncbi:MAG: alpha/beta hydrolase [Rickettsiaceae bacterium]|nr:MAG: alpha/beta hydrolase [Rickettsiaceae bacterium]
MTKYLFKGLLTIFFLINTSACTLSLADKVQSARNLSKEHGFVEKLVQGDQFLLTTYQKITNQHLPFVFYVESDGLVYDKYGAISENPTPQDQLLLKLALVDNRPNVVYIARPCQYTSPEINPLCNSSIYWTERRMSEEVVSSINKAIETINPLKQNFSLIGYSGGGGIVVIIAARNKYVKDILTIAGNLDTVYFNKYHDELSANRMSSDTDSVKHTMEGSLNPIDYAMDVKNVPQLHLSGAEDKIVPPIIAQNYVQYSDSLCVHQKIIPDVSHNVGWKEKWLDILAIPIKCN